MRVRYGKPIKAINLSNVTKSFSTTSAISLLSGCGGQWVSNAHKSYLYQQLATRRTHKVFMLYQVNSSSLPALSDVMRLIIVRANGNSVIGEASVYKTDNMYYGIASIGTGTSSDTETSDIWLQLNSGKTFIVNTSYTWFMIDLTDSFGSGKEPTAQEFYNKYNKYFPLIATGEEITIDDKAGQVSYVIEEGTTNLGNTSSSYSNKEDGSISVCSSWGGDEGTCTWHHSGGYNNYPYKVYHKTATGTGGIFRNTTEDIIIEAGKTYTMSVYIKANRNINNVSAYTFNINRGSGNRYITYNQSFNITTEWKRLIRTFTATSDDAGTYKEMSILYDDGAEDYYVYYSGFQIEEKDHATPFVIGTRPDNYKISCKVAGGSSDIYYRYNQLIQNGDFSSGSTNWSVYSNIVSWTQNNNIAEVTIIKDVASESQAYTSRIIHSDFDVVVNHKYLAICQVKTNNYAKIRLSLNLVGGQDQSYVDVNTSSGDWVVASRFYTNTSLTQMRISTYPLGSLAQWTKYYVKNVMFIDLTDWYGEGSEPSTVAEFKEKFTKDYYGTCLTPIKLTRYQIEALPSYGYNQLISMSQKTNYNGITWTPGDDGIYTLTGTSTSTYSSWSETLVDNHKYIVALNILTNPNNIQLKIGLLNIYGGSTDFIASGKISKIVTYSSGGGKSFGIVFTGANQVMGGMKIQVMLIDLTDWYGEGNEPATIEEFKQTFPNKYYPYSKKRLLNKYVINKLIN